MKTNKLQVVIFSKNFKKANEFQISVVLHELKYLKKKNITNITFLFPARYKRNLLDIIEQKPYADFSFSVVTYNNAAEKAEAVNGLFKKTGSEYFLFIESIYDFLFDPAVLISQHFRNHADITLSLNFSADTSAGRSHISIDRNYMIRSGAKKNESVKEGYINTGVYILNRNALSAINPKTGQLSNKKAAAGSFRCQGIPLPAAYKNMNSSEDRQSIIGFKNKAVFLDRDGIINRDTGYLVDVKKVKFCKGIFSFCRTVINHGYIIIVVSNQSGVGKGYFTENMVKEFNNWISRQFLQRGIQIKDFFICPFHSEALDPEYKRASLYRKPEPGMILEAAEKWNIDLTKSFMVGDKHSDRIKLPYLRSYVIKSKYASEEYDFDSITSLKRKLFPENKK